MDLYCNEDISSLMATYTQIDENLATYTQIDENLATYTQIDESLGFESLDFSSVSESDCEFIEMSFQKETNFRPGPVENQAQKWPKSDRLEALKWILQTVFMFGYHHHTAYLSLMYFDQFLAKKSYSDEKPMWTTRILSITCLSLAAKMEEEKARLYTEYHVKGYDFQGTTFKKMELHVLDTLGWKMALNTPFTYLNYFVTKFGVEKSRQQESVTQAADLILVIMEEINVAENRPSIVAAASVLAAYDRYLDKTMLENKIDAIPTWGSEEKRQTYSCYCLLQDIVMLKTPKSAIIPSSLSVVDPMTTPRGGSKRSLTFDIEDQHFSVKKSTLP